MRILLTCLFSIVFTVNYSFSYAGEYKISGKVADSESKAPMPFTTVAVLGSDGTIITGTTTDDFGVFKITNINEGNYIIQVSFLGYITYSDNVTVNKDINLGTIFLNKDTKSIKGIEIIEKRPLIEQKADKLVMNVSDNASAQSDNAIDVLKKAPGVFVNKDGDIQLNGETVAVWIDDRPTYLSGKDLEALLLSTDGNEIDKLEIIANPSSRYDAEGSGGIINIVTKKNLLQGFNGSVGGSYSGSIYHKYFQEGNARLMLNLRTKHVNTMFNFGGGMDNGFGASYKKTFSKDRIIEQQNISEDFSKRYNFKLAQDFYINKRNVIGYIVRGGARAGNSNSDNERSYNNLYDTDYNLLSMSPSFYESHRKSNRINANINYTHYFNEEKTSDITFNANYRNFNTPNSVSESKYTYLDSLENEIRPPYAFRDITYRKFRVLDAKTDFSYSFNKSTKLEAGLKFSNVYTDNEMNKDELINTEWVQNNIFNNKFNYTENIGSAYATFSTNINMKWMLQAGLRAEQTINKGNWISADTTINNKYFNLFPTLYAGYMPNQNFRYGVSYTYRIRRPSYRSLNPFVNYIDVYNIEKGNPDLQPTFYHITNINFGFKRFLNVYLSGFFANNINSKSYIYNEALGKYVHTVKNDGKSQSYALGINLSELPITDWFYIYAGVHGGYNIVKQSDYESKNFGLYGNVQTTFYLPKDFKIEFGGWATTGSRYGKYNNKPMYSFDFGIKKDLWDKKATLTLNVDDVFRISKYEGTFNNSETDYYEYKSYSNSQIISLGFSYRFGTVIKEDRRNLRLEEDTRMNGGNDGMPIPEMR